MMNLDLFCEMADRIIREGLRASSTAFGFVHDAEYTQAWKTGESPEDFGDRIVVRLQYHCWCE